MAIKKTSTTPLVKVGIRLDWNESILLPFKEASQLMMLLEGAKLYNEAYGLIPKEQCLKKDTVKLEIMDMRMYEQALVAQTMGMTASEYHESLKEEN